MEWNTQTSIIMHLTLKLFSIALMTNGVRVSVARGAGGGGSGTARSRGILAKQVILPKGPN